MRFVLIKFSPDVYDAGLTDEVYSLMKTIVKGTGDCIKRFPLDDDLSDRVPFVPLFACDGWEDVQRESGVRIPNEFIIERKDLVPEIDENVNTVDALPTMVRPTGNYFRFKSNPIENLKRRIGAFHQLYSDRTPGISIYHLRDWLAGLFRKYMFIDPSVHGTSSKFRLNDDDHEGRGEDDYNDPFFMAVVAQHMIQQASATSGEADPHKILEKAKKEIKRREGGESVEKDAFQFISRFTEKANKLDSLYPYRILIESVFREEIESIKESLKGATIGRGGNEAETGQDFRVQLRRFPECKLQSLLSPTPETDRFPQDVGGSVRFMTPTGKINVLVIDDDFRHIKAKLDNAERPEASNLQSDKEYWAKLLSEGSNIQYLRVVDRGCALQDKSGTKSLCRTSSIGLLAELRQRLHDLRHNKYSFDLVLIGLMITQDPNDVMSYQVEKLVHEFFPDVPIAIYSLYGGMTRIVSALNHRIKWFFKKTEEQKFPRHFCEMARLSGWRQESSFLKKELSISNHFCCSSVGDEREKNRSERFFEREFKQNDRYKFITYKHLEHQAGHYITIGAMEGGVGSAVTFKATKGGRLDGLYLQMPYIVKIDHATSMRLEYERYVRFIRPYIANQVGRIEKEAIVLGRYNASIMYTFVGHTDEKHRLASLEEDLKRALRNESSCDYEKFRGAFERVFDEILPQLHCVTPEREEGWLEDNQNDFRSRVCEPKLQNLPSSFPNSYFNEFEWKDFANSYRLRMPPTRAIEIRGNQVVSQPIRKDGDGDTPPVDETDGKPLFPFVFHKVYVQKDWNSRCVQKNKYKPVLELGEHVLEAYDKKWNLVWLKGVFPEHVARFRKSLSCGQTIWVKDLDPNSLGKDRTFSLAWYEERLRKFRDWAKLREFELPVDFLNPTEMRFAEVCCDIQDELLRVAQKVGNTVKDKKIDNAKAHYEGKVTVGGCEFASPLGIVHGDLNFSNIMLDYHRRDPLPDRPDDKWEITDTWLIDFARTRRDIIAHDFNVAFTSTFLLLFDDEIFKDVSSRPNFWDDFIVLIRDSFLDETDDVTTIPDAFREKARFAFVYRILHRIRMAAIKAEVSKHMYLLTSALSCSYAIRIFLEHEQFPKVSALAIAMKICYDLLRDDWLGADNVGPLKFIP